jgi:alkylation response protein AidB-like acyl-CoA dehydrogenase
MKTIPTFLKGGEFIIKNGEAASTFTREDLSEEAFAFADMVQEFVYKKVKPLVAKIDKGAQEEVVRLLDELGTLGVLSAALPEEFGGMGVDFGTESIINEELGRSSSFSVSVAAHTGIGTLPILYFGTEAQKQKYLPGLGSGALKASYCLTEPWSGSDALGARTKAVLSPDGNSYILNGQKMWITNAGFADVFIVFAQINGDQFTGFIVEKGTSGLSLGAEEDKMGIKGSSTRQVFFENVVIPKENVLGEIGKGHKIAFNVLNIGRYKLSVQANGASKDTINHAITYAKERQQFKTAIANFGAIKHKLGEMAIKIWITDAANYRVAGLMQHKIEELVLAGKTKTEAKLAAAEEYNIECALLKVLGSETLDYVVDETVQIYGGMGFSEEAPAARAYRDSRINRIFEGTNEINRLLSVGTLIKKALKGELDIIKPAKDVQRELMSIPDLSASETSLFSEEKTAINNAKKAVLMIAGAAVQQFKDKLDQEQEIIMAIADMLLEIFAAESGMLRAEKIVEKQGEEKSSFAIEIAKTYLSDAMEKINISGKHALAAFASGDALTMMYMGLKRFTKYPMRNNIASRQLISEQIVKEGKYCFDGSFI